ncbi:hypothetical protein ABZV91_31785 [Nocardia sp. NPDC004568]|uniref:hypothetical protein n=1 Tax=Nocardia sp. NPDC004568 TaxID=3154551 RepID=UPI0033A1D35D
MSRCVRTLSSDTVDAGSVTGSPPNTTGEDKSARSPSTPAPDHAISSPSHIASALGPARYTRHSLRAGADWIADIRSLPHRLSACGTVAVSLVAIGLFGGMPLLPLYDRTVRHEGAFDAGHVVSVGVVLGLTGTYPFTQVDIGTSCVWPSIALFNRGTASRR